MALRAAGELIEVWLRGLPRHEEATLRALALAIAQAKKFAAELPPSIDRTCRDLIAIKLEEAEHWGLAALRAAVDRADREQPWHPKHSDPPRRAPCMHTAGPTCDICDREELIESRRDTGEP